MEDSREFRRCSSCEGPECIAWDYMAWDCCHITGADHLVSREELFAAVKEARGQATTTCPHCGAHLDADEVCDCQIGAALLLTEDAAEHWGDEKTAPSAANTEDGKEAQHDT